MKKTLIIVDVQEDFYSPTGKLSVPGGDKVVEHIKELIKKDKDIRQVIFTADWHTPEDCSFKENGGPWNPHCVKYTSGASIHPDLLNAVLERGFKSLDGKFYKEGIGCEGLTKDFLLDTYDVFTKGDDPNSEEYGAFYNMIEVNSGVISLSGISDESESYIDPDSDIIVCGIAGDYCVKETTKNLLNIEKLKGDIIMFLPGIASIDDGTTINNFIKENNLKIYE